MDNNTAHREKAAPENGTRRTGPEYSNIGLSHWLHRPTNARIYSFKERARKRWVDYLVLPDLPDPKVLKVLKALRALKGRRVPKALKATLAQPDRKAP